MTDRLTAERTATLSDAALLAALRRLYAKQGRPVPGPEFCGFRGQLPTPKRQKPHDLPASFGSLPPGQRRVAEALVGGEVAKTYPAVAEELGIHVGSVYRHLRRLRQRRPETYAELVALRRRQLDERHRGAVKRAAEHSARWHKKQANRRYHDRFGMWPWERW